MVSLIDARSPKMGLYRSADIFHGDRRVGMVEFGCHSTRKDTEDPLSLLLSPFSPLANVVHDMRLIELPFDGFGDAHGHTA